MQEIGGGLADELSGADEGGFGQLVTLSGGFGNLAGGQCPGTQTGIAAGCNLFGNVFGDGRARCNCLEMAFDPA